MAGQLIQRGERTWLVRVYLRRDPVTGKRRYHNKTIHGNKKDAQRYLNQVLADKDLGTFVEPSRQTLSAYLDEWLRVAAKPRVRDRSYRDYEEVLRRYVRLTLGSCRLAELSPVMIQYLYTRLTERG